MSETRRDLFRASVVSALGAVGLSALAGCGRFSLLSGPPTSTNVPVVGKGDDPPYWYLFVYDNNALQYRVWRTDQRPPSDPNTSAFDTADWYARLEGMGKLTLVTHGTTPQVKIAGRVYDTDANGYLSGTSQNTMQQQAYTMMWMEVGGKKNNQ